METINILNRYNIFACSLHEFLPVEAEKFYMVYAPLSTMAMLASANDMKSLAEALGEKPRQPEMVDLLESLLDTSASTKALSRSGTVSDFINMSLIITNRCNFHCNYCYSAKGRTNETMPEERMIAAVDYFVDSRRTEAEQLSITFLGGGEPMLSWELVKRGIVYAEQRAEKQKFKIRFKLITNGSILPPDFIDFVADRRVDVLVSFDILEDVQNLQRRHFDLVRDNIRQLLRRDIMVSINSVITPLNVTRQTEMLDKAVEMFPEINHLAFESCKEINIDFSNSLNEDYYNSYTDCFLEARQKAKEKNITLTSTVLRSVDCIVERFCPGEFAINPDGSITSCPCVSSSEMDSYKHYGYGKIDSDGQVFIDEKKLTALLNENVHSFSECTSCFVKWNCGGDCLPLHQHGVDIEKRKWRCCFIQKFIKRVLWERIREQYETDSGLPVMEILMQNQN